MPIKLMAASRRRPGLTRAEYQRYLEFYHGTIARQERFKIRHYMQNHVIDGAFGVLSDATHEQVVRARRRGGAAVRHLSATCWRRSSRRRPRRPRRTASSSPTSAPTSSSWPRKRRCRCRRRSRPFNPGLGIVSGVGALKVLQYIMRADDVYPRGLLPVLARGARAGDGQQAPYAREQLRRCVMNKRCRANDNDAAARKHFKMVDPPVYDMVVTHWYDTIEQAGAFRQYMEALQRATRRSSPTGRSRSTCTPGRS